MKRTALRLIPGLIIALSIHPAARAQSILGPILGAQHGSLTPAVTGLTFNASTVNEFGSSTGTVTLSVPAPTPGGSTVLLSSGNAAVQVPASVTVPAGSNSANFGTTTSTVASSTPVTVTATLNGSAQGTLTVNPPPTSPTHWVGLTFTASTTTATPYVDGYNVFRATVSGGPYTQVNSALILVTSPNTPGTTQYTYIDTAVTSGTTYYYVGKAVVNGVASSASTTCTAGGGGSTCSGSGEAVAAVP